MTVDRKHNQIKAIVFLLSIILVSGLFGYRYSSYSGILSDRENEIKEYEEKVSIKEKDILEITKKINNLKKEKAEKLKQGLDIKKVKKDISSMLSSSQSVRIKVNSVNYHKNYNNLLDVKLQIISGRNATDKIVDRFSAKQLLNLKSVKNYFKVYGDYTINGDIVKFQYLD